MNVFGDNFICTLYVDDDIIKTAIATKTINILKKIFSMICY